MLDWPPLIQIKTKSVSHIVQIVLKTLINL